MTRNAVSDPHRTTRAELVLLHAASRLRVWIGAALLAGGLALLFGARVAIAAAVARARAAGRPISLSELFGAEPWAVVAVVAGLLAAFAGTLLTALSLMHARHVARGIAELDARGAPGEPAARERGPG